MLIFSYFYPNPLEYLGSVLEDLGLRITPDLSGISKLVKNLNNLNDPTVTAGISARLISAVKKMKTKPLS